MKTILGTLGVVALGLVCVGFYATRTAVEPASAPAPALRTATIKRGDLSRTLSAKGTVKLEQVEVGTQITGMIASFGCDPADPSKPLDCGSRVHKGTILAQINSTIFKAQVDYAEAAIAAAKANLVQLQARRDQTEQEWRRAKSLQPAKAIAESEYDLALTNYRVAEANVAVGEAAVQESEASLRMAKTNLDYTVIRSPDDGVIIERRVAIGQTVTMVPGFNAPGLFLIVKDSRQVQVWASVNEANIAYIHPGAPAQFTVNARLDESFEGHVAQVRQSPTKQGDAITYTVVVVAENLGKLLPDMTADLKFVVDRRPNVLLIPNDALQSPSPTQVADKIQTTAPIDALSQPADVDANAKTEVSLARRAIRLWNERKVNRRLWVRDGGMVRPVEVQLGASNGLMTEITGNNVREGMEVVLGEVCMTQGR